MFHKYMKSLMTTQDILIRKVVKAQMMNFALVVITLIIGVLALVLLNRGIVSPIKQLSKDLRALSEGNGDLTKRIEVKSKDEVGEMTIYFNTFIENIHNIVKDISNISGVLSNNMETISNTTRRAYKINRDDSNVINGCN